MIRTILQRIAIAFAILVLIGIVEILIDGSVPTRIDEPAIVTVAAGEGAGGVASILEKKGIVRRGYLLYSYLWITGKNGSVQAGDFIFQGSYSLSRVAEVITQKPAEEESNEVAITIPEGWTLKKIAALLDEKNLVSYDTFLATTETIAKKNVPYSKDPLYAGIAENESLEGYLFPDTYRVYKNAKPEDIIEKMLDTFDQRIDKRLRDRQLKSGLTWHQVITLASIVEREVPHPADRARIAGIFLNRLDAKMPLQSDATVNYVTGKSSLQPSEKELSVDSPYNTYRYRGLPPGPIANPGVASIEAVLFPEKTSYFFFLTTSDGTVVYSKTFDEHVKNKQKYLQ